MVIISPSLSLASSVMRCSPLLRKYCLRYTLIRNASPRSPSLYPSHMQPNLFTSQDIQSWASSTRREMLHLAEKSFLQALGLEGTKHAEPWIYNLILGKIGYKLGRPLNTCLLHFLKVSITRQIFKVSVSFALFPSRQRSCTKMVPVIQSMWKSMQRDMPWKLLRLTTLYPSLVPKVRSLGMRLVVPRPPPALPKWRRPSMRRSLTYRYYCTYLPRSTTSCIPVP